MKKKRRRYVKCSVQKKTFFFSLIDRETSHKCLNGMKDKNVQSATAVSRLEHDWFSNNKKCPRRSIFYHLFSVMEQISVHLIIFSHSNFLHAQTSCCTLTLILTHLFLVPFWNNNWSRDQPSFITFLDTSNHSL